MPLISYFLNLRTSEIHLFYNLQLFYWHFLEILWLFIFLVFYSSFQLMPGRIQTMIENSFGRALTMKQEPFHRECFYVTGTLLSLGAVIAIFSGVIFNGEKIVASKNLLPSSSSRNSLYHLVSTFIGILLTFSPMHFLGFNVMPRRIPDFPDSFHSWKRMKVINS